MFKKCVLLIVLCCVAVIPISADVKNTSSPDIQDVLSQNGFVLNKYRKAQVDAIFEKMHEKYPSYNVEILRCEPKSLLGPAYDIYYVTDDLLDTVGRAVYLYPTDIENEYEIVDNFIGKIMETKYAETLFLKLEQIFSACYLVETEISDVYGDEYTENITVDDVMDGKYPMWNRTKIYLRQSDISLEDVKDYLMKTVYCGSYQLIITDGDIVLSEETFLIPFPKNNTEE